MHYTELRDFCHKLLKVSTMHNTLAIFRFTFKSIIWNVPPVQRMQTRAIDSLFATQQSEMQQQFPAKATSYLKQHAFIMASLLTRGGPFQLHSEGTKINGEHRGEL